jgi:hypothetical protein
MATTIGYGSEKGEEKRKKKKKRAIEEVVHY